MQDQHQDDNSSQHVMMHAGPALGLIHPSPGTYVGPKYGICCGWLRAMQGRVLSESLLSGKRQVLLASGKPWLHTHPGHSSDAQPGTDDAIGEWRYVSMDAIGEKHYGYEEVLLIPTHWLLMYQSQQIIIKTPSPGPNYYPFCFKTGLLAYR